LKRLFKVTKEKAERLEQTKTTVTTNLLTWLTIHGNLCLALRHPENQGPSREYIVNFVKNLGRKLVEWGVYTETELEYAERIEVEEGSYDFRR